MKNKFYTLDANGKANGYTFSNIHEISANPNSGERRVNYDWQRGYKFGTHSRNFFYHEGMQAFRVANMNVFVAKHKSEEEWHVIGFQPLNDMFVDESQQVTSYELWTIERFYINGFHLAAASVMSGVTGAALASAMNSASKNASASEPINVEPVAAEPEPVNAVNALAKKFEEVDLNNPQIKHERYELVKTCLQAGLPVYLAGPAGSGKNFTVEQMCEELGWDFFFSNSVQQEYKLTGFIDAGGDFHETEFYKACTCQNDCVFFLDEIDASIPEVLVLLNAAIANGYFEFPNGKVSFDKVHFVAAGNTVGSGADEMYTGRMVIDQATLDRFVIVDFDYSTQVEMFISKNNHELVDFVHQLREQAEAKGIRATFSYRCITHVTKLEESLELEVVLAIAVMKGLDQDTINTFETHKGNKYFEALYKMQKAA